MMSQNFNRAFIWVMKAEGGYVNDPRDAGGETKYGISKKSYPNLDIANLTVDQAQQIYYKDYWVPCVCESMNENLALCVFDSAVNQGVSRAVKILQQTLKINPDGIMGKQTLSALGSIDSSKIISNFMSNRVLAYSSLGDSWKSFGRGWMNRCFELMEFIYA